MKFGTAYYDLARNPPSFNFLDFLLEAEKWRLKNGLDRLTISVLPGPMEGFRRDCLPPSGGAVRTSWLNNIVIPMARLLPSCGEEAKFNHQASEGITMGRDKYLIGLVSLFDSASQNLYSLKAPQEDVERKKQQHGKYITITIRNTGWWVQRTSNVGEWTIVAREIERQGYKVVFIPDGTKPNELVDGFENDPIAAQNSFNRAVLYQGSEMNFGLPSGPMWMCWFMGVPIMMVKMVNDNEPPTTEAMYRRVGIKPGGVMPNAKHRQTMLWKPEQADLILQAFEAVMQ